MALPSGLTNFFTCLQDYGEDRFLCAFLVEEVRSRRKFVLRTPLGRRNGQGFSAFFRRCCGIRPINTPQFAGVGERNGVAYVLEQPIDASPLASVDHSETKPEDLLGHIATMCNALQLAHQQGVHHLCMRSSDILVGAGGPKLTGFGLEIFVGTGLLNGLSADDTFFIAPEILAPSPSYDKRSDVFSLGRTVTRLFPGLRNHPVIQQATHPDPGQRYAGAMPFKAALTGIDLEPLQITVQTDTSGAVLWINGIDCGVCPYPDGIATLVTYPVDMRAVNGASEKTLTLTTAPADGVILLQVSAKSGSGGFEPKTEIRTIPPGCRVWINGTDYGPIPADGRALNIPFPWQVEWESGGKTHRQTFATAPANGVILLQVSAKSNSGGIEPKTEIRTIPPGCRVWINDTDYGPIPADGRAPNIPFPWHVEWESGGTTHKQTFATAPADDIITLTVKSPITLHAPNGSEVFSHASGKPLGVSQLTGLSLNIEDFPVIVEKAGFHAKVVFAEEANELVTLDRVVVRISTNPPGAEIRMRDVTLGSTEYGPVELSWPLHQGLKLDLVHPDCEPAHYTVPAVCPWHDVNETVTLKRIPRTCAVAITSDPKGAEVYIGGVHKGQTPLTFNNLPPTGSTTFTAKAHGYQTSQKTITHSANNAHFTLTPALLNIRTNPTDAQVFVEGGRYAKTGSQGIDVPWHKGPITIRKDGYKKLILDFNGHPPPTMNRVETLTSVSQTCAVTITSDPKGAEVYIGGVHKGQTPLTLNNLPPTGSTTFTAKAHGYQTSQKTITDSSKNVHFTLTPALLNIRTIPTGAQVFVEGESYGETGQEWLAVPWHKSQITIYKEGYKELTLNFVDEPPPKRNHIETLEMIVHTEAVKKEILDCKRVVSWLFPAYYMPRRKGLLINRDFGIPWQNLSETAAKHNNLKHLKHVWYEKDNGEYKQKTAERWVTKEEFRTLYQEIRYRKFFRFNAVFTALVSLVFIPSNLFWITPIGLVWGLFAWRGEPFSTAVTSFFLTTILLGTLVGFVHELLGVAVAFVWFRCIFSETGLRMLGF